jgi:hypothetical protein
LYNATWVGIGFTLENPASIQMGKGTDMMTINQDEGFNYLEDRTTIGTGYPPLDITQGGKDDLVLVDFVTTDDLKSVKFKRLKQTGDIHDIDLLENNDYYILFAWGVADHFTYHGQTNRSYTPEMVRLNDFTEFKEYGLLGAALVLINLLI